MLLHFLLRKAFLLHFLFERKRSKRKVGRDEMAKICSSRAKPVIKGTASLLFFIVGISIANTCYDLITVLCPYRFLTLFRNKFLHAISVKGRKDTFVDNPPPIDSPTTLRFLSPAALRLLNLVDLVDLSPS